MISYMTSNDPSTCCGCTACVHICTQEAIHMETNREGFLYPAVDNIKCTNCGMCNKVCPVEHVPLPTGPNSIYAVINRDEEALKRSSSGGAFRLLADWVIAQNGCVIGCVWDEQNRPILKPAEKKEDLYAMQGSKYLSSNPGDVFPEILRRLNNGQIVLFTGAPCQNAGLLNYLRKPYDNLLTVDFLCHGMPSQKAFDAYVNMLEQKYHGKVRQFQFRDKSIRGWALAESFVINEKKMFNIGLTSPYDYGFLNGYFNRYSCYSCPFRGKCFTDFTISDYWGVGKYHPDIEAEKGVSAVSVNTGKGETLFNRLTSRCSARTTQAEWVAKENPSLLHDGSEEAPALRREIYRMIERDGWKRVEKKYLRCKHYALKKLWYSLPKDAAKRIKRLLKRG